MRTLEVKICRESSESQRAAGRYNPASVAIWHTGKPASKRHRLILGAGSDDLVYFFREDSLVYVVSINTHLDYVGLQVYDESTGDEIGDCFMQSEEHWREALGPQGLDLHPRNIAKRLADYAIQ